jgi:hypothetical protein
MKKLTFIKSFFSPFKRPKLKWYIGRVKIGTPYFLPRRWKNPSHKEARKLALKKYREWVVMFERNSKLKHRPYQNFYDEVMRSQIAVPKKIGFDFVGLGYKIKWSDTDYRFEWSPLISFVFFGLQIAIMVIPEHQNHYWEAWLFYENDTDKTKSPKERIKQCKEEFSMKYTTSSKEEGRKEIDYYDLILK